MRTFVVAVFLLACAGSAWAQGLKIAFNDGRVSIDAANVPVRTVLAEWARLGGTKVVGGDRITGSPLTIHLEDVPEAQALEIVLRNVAGYMAAPRQMAVAGASTYDRILVMPTSSAPAASATPGRPGANAGNPNAQRNGRPPAFVAPAPESDAPAPVVDEADTGVNEPPFQFPQQNPFQVPPQPGPFGTPMAPGGQPPVITFGQPATQGVSINPPPDQPMAMPFPGTQPAQPGAPTGGFGIMGAPTPGVILQPPQPAQPGRPPGER